MIKRKLAIIDIGHGGNDSGACANGIKEKDANLVTGLALAEKLKANGWIVILTRDSDYAVSLAQRVAIANKYGVDCIFISIHHNAGGGDRAEGIYSIYEGDGKTLANSITLELFNQLDQQKKLYSKKGTDNKDYYYVIKNTVMPAIIVEVAFLDNTEDVKICDTVEEQQRNGRVIADGVIKWFNGDLTTPMETPVEKPKPTPPQNQSKWDYEYDSWVGELQDYLIARGHNVSRDCIAGDLTYGAISGYTLSNGERATLAKLVQKRLGVNADGIVGPITYKAINDFQRDNGLGVGYLGGTDWYYLIR